MQELKVLEGVLRRQDKQYLGKYRGFVQDNKDPERRGRLKVSVPTVLGDTTTDWILPCFPYGGGAGFGWLSVPPSESQVVVEFLEGDISSPMWTGTFWRTAEEVPEDISEGDDPTTTLLRTESGHVLCFEDKDDSTQITMRSSKEAVIDMNHDGSIALTGSDGGTVTLDSKAGTLTVADANNNTLTMSSGGIEASDGNGNTISTSQSGVEVSSTTIKISGSSVTVGTGSAEPLIKGSTFLSLFNAHTHNATALGSPTTPPLIPLSPSVLTTATKGA